MCMKCTIKNDIVLTNPPQLVVDYINENLIIDNPIYQMLLKMGKPLGKVPKKIRLYSRVGQDCYILPFGCLGDIWKLIPDKTLYNIEISNFKGNSMIGNINLYDYQKMALKSLIKGKNGILEAPCGSGKTNIALQLIKEIGGRALWLTHTSKLLEQSKKRCESYFKGDFGTITEGKVDIGKDITFATVQTMSKIDPELYKNAFDIVIVDECHHCIGSPTNVMQFYKVVTNCNCRYKYGMSATLKSKNSLSKSLYYIIGKKLYTIDKNDVKDVTIKASHIKVDVNIQYNQVDYCSYDGTMDFIKLINMLVTNEERNQIIVQKVFEEFTKGKYQLILTHRVEHAKTLANLISRFAKVSLLTGSTSKSKRNYDSSILIATYQLAQEGLDIPQLNVLHLTTPQKNSTIVTQCVGRVERYIEGKETPLVYDYVDVSIPYCTHCFTTRKNIIKKK